jgi:hypothetical protein
MTNETTLDIRKVPVSELQTRDGGEVLGVFDNTKENESSMWRCLVVMKLEDGGLDSVTMSTAGRVWSDRETAFDIIRKKQLKGRVLYKQHGSYHISDDSWTEEDFVKTCCTNSYPTASNPQFIRILTEVPELPTEEV